MLLKIYRNTAILAYIRPDENSELVQKLMSDDVVKLNFSHSSNIGLTVGDYIEYFGKTYTLNKRPYLEKSASNEFKYQCRFEGSIYDLDKAKFFLGNDYTFDLTGDAAFFLGVCVSNLNRDLGGYSVGNADTTLVKTLSFDKLTVLEAVKLISTELDVEFYLDGKTLHFESFGVDNGNVFKVGRFVGMYNLTRKNVESTKITTRLWAYGSTKNLPPDYVSPLAIKRLAFKNLDLSNESRVENNVNLYGLIEDIEEFDIYPTRTGVVTGIDAGNNRIFIDTAMDFDLNAYLLPGVKPKANFKTGNLAGIDFDLSYNDATKTFTIDYFSDDSGTYPNETLKFAIGDSYVLYDIYLPVPYVTDAENRLRTAADLKLAEISQDNVLYSLLIDPRYIRDNAITLDIGNYITITVADLQVNGLLRILTLQRAITNPAYYILEVGTLIPTPLLIGINKSLKGNTTTINNVVNNTYNKSETVEQIALNGGVKWQ